MQLENLQLFSKPSAVRLVKKFINRWLGFAAKSVPFVPLLCSFTFLLTGELSMQAHGQADSR